MRFSNEEYFATYDDALAELSEAVSKQQKIIEVLFAEVNETRVAAGNEPLVWADIVNQPERP